jgi:O-antigen/teichoic acid export membrane protein
MSDENPSQSAASNSDNKTAIKSGKVIKNAFANVARGSTGALVVVLLPPFLTRSLSVEAYGTWLLIVQLSAYVSFLDFGIQTAVGRFVAHTNELQDLKQRDSVVSTSLAILMGAGLLGFIGVLALVWQLPNLFHGMPTSLHQDARIALLFVGGSLAIGLPFSVFSGIFVGLQRYDIPAWVIGISKLLGGVLTVMLANATHNIAWMGAGMALATVGAAGGQFLACRKFASSIKISIKLISKKAGREIVDYCFSLTIWSISMLLVSGLDTAIVGYFDYKSVAFYSLAVSLTTFLIGLNSSIFNVLMPSAAIMGAKENYIGLGKLLVDSTRYSLITLILTSAPLVVGAEWILDLWLGPEYARHTAPILQLLVIANVVRQSGFPYSIIAIATGQQRLMIITPFIEGLTNFTSSVLLANFIGASGVAIGTLIGGLIGISFSLIYNIPRTKKIITSPQKLLLEGLIRPLVCMVPSLGLYLVMIAFPTLKLDFQIIYFITSIIASILMLWFYGLKPYERKNLTTKVFAFQYGLRRS